MKKIENTIENCAECRFSKEFQELKGNSDFVLICTNPEGKSFLIVRENQKIKDFMNVDIPENCPLENYTEQ
ncbi:hypothetical protein MWN41_05405 [Ornithobacterium rhinotracheale]|uniref:hypothetical protein n=1 Tax=Ornithobacterium rhinotracheale TaxID=28251 RepID=UPI001FF239D5|nr:hypothetical protein [Ornithobacterium rhinotracheale]MCK0202455.1 hypothetical protein [Ornithobacterium rhinotracheale]